MQKRVKMVERMSSVVMAAGDGGEVVEGFADILGDEVAGEAVVQAGDGAGYGGSGRRPMPGSGAGW